MGYEILYNWQFLRSNNGITPVILSGSNNVTTLEYNKNGRAYERREREWWCLFNMIGVTPDEFLTKVQEMECKDEIWKYGGKWVNGKDVQKWAKNAVKKAAAIEDVLLFNRPIFLTATAKLIVWPKKDEDGWSRDELTVSICTTEELDRWIREAKTRMEELKKEGRTVFPIIRFSDENLVKVKPLPEKILLKTSARSFISDIEVKDSEIRAISYGPINKARVFTKEEYVALLKMRNMLMLKGIFPVAYKENAETAGQYNAVIIVEDTLSGKLFVSKVGPHSFWRTGTKGNAKRYKDIRAAKAAAEKLALKYPKFQFSAGYAI